MTPEQLADLAADLYRRFRAQTSNKLPNGTALFSQQHAFDMTQTVLREVAARRSVMFDGTML